MLLVCCFEFAEAKKVFGYTDETCARWTQERLKDKAQPNSFGAGFTAWGMQQWSLGIVSGINVYSDEKDFLVGLDAEAIWRWLDQHCSANPQVNFGNTVFELIEALQQRAQ